MKRSSNTFQTQQQMTRVIVLLIILVIVPTICLVWFMGAALKNSRLALRQELANAYLDRARTAMPTDANTLAALASDTAGAVVYGEQGQRAYPLLYVNPPTPLHTPEFETALALEHQDHEWQQAFDLYRLLAMESSIPDVVYDCTVGQIRCLKALERWDEAMALCRTLGVSEAPAGPLFRPNQKAHASLMLADLAVEVNDLAALQLCLSSVMASEKVATETQIFVLQRMVDLIQDARVTEGLQDLLDGAHQQIRRGSLSVAAADRFPDAATLEVWDNGAFQRLPLNGVNVYARAGQVDGQQTLALVSDASLQAFFASCSSRLNDDKVFSLIHDQGGNPLGSASSQGTQFHTISLTGALEGWTVDLMFREGIFAELAQKQRGLYLWAAINVVVLTVALSVVVGRTLGREIKLGRLKNDFMATVTHELKTPLASTRLLVDTLLEEQCADPVRVQEYLTLIATENRRLAGLIDNFLTFSRMERNKQVFDRQFVSVEACVQAANEAVRTRMHDTACDYTCSIEENLPELSVDKPAFVTVLVNLLDNALKYTGRDKVISLRVSQEGGLVCFRVKDNGMGMTSRQAKRAFDRFYQADTSLTRDTHGCGLGLAIVKFIVDAHEGQVTVESQPGKGSEFAVRMPA